MACACNWTSFFRNDDAQVPSVEKYRDPSHANPQTLQELTEFGATLETGDILLMHCTHSFGKLAQLGTFSPWDHMAMVVKCSSSPESIAAREALVKEKPPPPSSTLPWPAPGEEPVEILEAMAGGSYTYAFTAHAIARGRFCKYVAVRRLRNKEGQPLTAEQQSKLEAFVKEYWARPYEQGRKGLMELSRPVFRMRNPDVNAPRDKSLETLDNLFCSELITEALQAAGILPEETLNSNELLPSMYAPGKAVDKYLEVQSHNYRLGELEVYKGPGTPLHKAILDKRKELRANKHKEDDPEGDGDEDDNEDPTAKPNTK